MYFTIRFPKLSVPLHETSSIYSNNLHSLRNLVFPLYLLCEAKRNSTLVYRGWALLRFRFLFSSCLIYFPKTQPGCAGCHHSNPKGSTRRRKICKILCKRNLQELCQLLVKLWHVAPEHNTTKQHKYVTVNIKASEGFTGRWGWRGVFWYEQPEPQRLPVFEGKQQFEQGRKNILKS